MKDFLPDVIGQKRVRQKLNFYLNSYQSNHFLPSLLLLGSGGCGKTLLARSIGKNLKKRDGTIKPFIELQSKALNDWGTFVRQIVEPFIVTNEEVTIFADELANAGKSILDHLFFFLQPSADNISKIRHNDEEYLIDFTRVSFIGATTNQEKLSKPLQSRFKKIELDVYSNDDLIQILQNSTKKIRYKNQVEQEIIKICRNSPRETIQVSKDIIQYCDYFRCKEFGNKDWIYLRKQLNINPLGLTNAEVELLKFLNERGAQTLTAEAAFMNRSPATIRTDIELFLLNKALIEIDGRRRITTKGRKLLLECQD